MRMATTPDDEQEPVGDRVEDLAERSTPGRSGGRCSRRPSRWRRGRRAAPAAADPVVLAEQQPQEQRQAEQPDERDDVRDREDAVLPSRCRRPRMAASRATIGIQSAPMPMPSSPASSTASCPGGSSGATTAACVPVDQPAAAGPHAGGAQRRGRPLDRPRRRPRRPPHGGRPHASARPSTSFATRPRVGLIDRRRWRSPTRTCTSSRSTGRRPRLRQRRPAPGDDFARDAERLRAALVAGGSRRARPERSLRRTA